MLFFVCFICVSNSNAATYTVGSGGDFVDIHSAISAASNGDTITLLSGNSFTICSTIVIDKSLTLQGQNSSTNVINCADLNQLIEVTASNVTLKDFTIYNQKGGSGFETCIAQTTLNATGLVFDGLIIETKEFGITLNASAYEIKNCQFKYMGTDTTNRYRFIYSYGNYGDCVIANNTFDGNNLDNLRTRPIALSDESYPAYRNFAGTLEISGNSFANGGLDAFIIMDAFGGSARDFALTVTDNNVVNTETERNGSFISFYSVINNPLDLFSEITVSGNTYVSTKGVGLITIEGYGTSFSPFNQLFTICDNSLSFSTVDATNFEDATESGLVAYDSTVYDPFTIGLNDCN